MIEACVPIFDNHHRHLRHDAGSKRAALQIAPLVMQSEVSPSAAAPGQKRAHQPGTGMEPSRHRQPTRADVPRLCDAWARSVFEAIRQVNDYVVTTLRIGSICSQLFSVISGALLRNVTV